MKKILPLLVLFVLSTHFILAQTTINIEKPTRDGLSNNEVTDFDVNANGTILNNSAERGRARLGNTEVSANPNITDREADVILFQVITNNSSDLNGRIEVFGSEAGVIIANPNGITCNGCGFINASKVDLVTGTANILRNTLNGFNINPAAYLRVLGRIGFVNDAVTDELNLASRYYEINAQVKANDTLRILAGNGRYNHITNTITSSSLLNPSTAPIDLGSSSNLRANSIELLATEENADYGIINEGNISANSLNITAKSFFINHSSATINANTLTIEVTDFSDDITTFATVSADTLNFILTNDFTHTSDSFNGFTFNNLGVSTDGYFRNEADLAVNSFNVTAGEYFWNRNSATINTGSFNVTAGTNFENHDNATINAGSFNVTTGTDFTNTGSTIKADSFNVTTGTRFYNEESSTIDADSFNVTTGTRFYNYAATINADNVYITAGTRFYNEESSTINANSVTIEVTDFAADIENTATVAADTLNLILTNNFTYSSDSFNGFTFNNLGVDTQGRFINEADLVVPGTLTIEVTDFAADIENTATVSADTLNLILTNNFTHTSDSFNGFTFNNLGISTYGYFANEADIVVDSFDATTGADFSNQNSAMINADSFHVTAGVSFWNINSATISADSFNVTAENGFKNFSSATINANSFNITAGGFYNNHATINADSLNITAGEGFTNQSFSTISAVSLNVTVGTSFINQSATIDVADSLNVTVGTNFTNYNSATISADSLNVTAEGDFENFASINADTLLNIALTDAAGSFKNTGGIASADTFKLSVAGDFNYISDFLNNGTINSNSFNLNVGGDFINNDAANDFTWGENNSLTVTGTASVFADSFNNSGTLNANSFNITATDITNTGTINADNILNTTLTSTADNSFANTGGVAADTFNLSVAGDFDYISDFSRNGTINTNSFNLNVGGDFSNNDAANDFTWGANDSLVVSGNTDITTRNFTQSGVVDVNGIFTINAEALIRNEGTIDTHTLVIDTDSIHNPGNITANTSLNITAINDVFSGGSITTSILNVDTGRNFANHGAITANNSFEITSGNTVENHGSIVSGSLDITAADYFRNLSGGDISVDTLNITAGGKVTNIATITTRTLNITANNNSSRTDDTTGFYVANHGDIIADTLNITAKGLVHNAATIDTHILTIDTDSIHNPGNITATTYLTITATNDVFSGGSITTSILDIDAGRNFANHGSITANNSFEITAGNTVENHGSIVSGSLDIIAADYFRNLNGGDINVATLNITAGGKVTNIATITAGTLNITANNNSSRTDDTTGFYVANHGDIIADTFNITAKGLIHNAATIDTHILTIDTDSIHNPGNITANTYLTITATNDVFSGGSITTSTLNIDAGRNFANHGDIIANNSFEITAGNTVENHGSIVSVSLDITADDYFRNLGGGDINVDTLNITAGGKVTNIATITARILNIAANNDSSRTDDTTGFYVANRGDIIADTLNIAAEDNFYNRGDITADTFNITKAKNIFFLNTEIASYTGTYDGGDVYLTGDSSFTATGRIENYGLIDLNDSSLDITAETFINQEDATIDAATLNLNVESSTDNGTITAITNITNNQ